MKARSLLWYRWALIMPLVMILALGLVLPVQAATFSDGPVIGPDEVIDDDVFLDGDTVRMEGTINGILVITANMATISGTVNGDVIAFGNQIKITEDAVINGNVFAGAQTIIVDGTVSGSIAGGSASMVLGETASAGRNVYYGGYALTMEEGATIDRGMYVGAYQAVLDGDIAQDLNVGSVALELNGDVGGNVVLDVEANTGQDFPSYWSPPGAPASIMPGLRIAESAEIGGSLTYTSPAQQADTIEAQPEGGIVYQTPVPDEVNKPEAGPGATHWRGSASPYLRWVFKFAQRLVTLLVLAGLALWLMPKLLKKTADKAADKMLPAAGTGFLALLAGYVGAFMAAILILGVGIFFMVITLGTLGRVVFGIGFSSLSLVFTIFLLLVNYGSKLVLAYLVGTRLWAQIAPNAKNGHVWGTLLGVLIYVLLRSIPILGGLIGLVVTVIGLGAMWLLFQDWRNGRKPAVEAQIESLPEETV
jgi:cytoskeletal protein CcmA (bactofilin family)